MNTTKKWVSAIVVAAGLSTRMGPLKQLLPYGEHTVIEQIVSVLLMCPLDEVVVVTGHARQAIEDRLAGWPVRPVFNPNFREGEMLSSVQCGLSAFHPQVEAALIVLGDQPQIEAGVVRQIIETYHETGASLVIPSFQMRRGHPMLIDRCYWSEILSLGADRTLREAVNAHAGQVHYVVVATDSVLRDMDTPEEYWREVGRLAAKKPAST
jgi:molybdenum cofactor cytidylyltransferase